MSQISTYRFGSFELDPRSRELRRDGRPLEAQPRVFDLVHYLVRHRDRVVERAELLREVWQGVHVEENSLYQAVSQARRLLATGSGSENPIALVRRRGYRFMAPVLSADAEQDRSPIGREAEMEALSGLVARVAQGQRQLVFVSGEAGIGKSVLVDAFVASQRSAIDGGIAYGRGFESHGGAEAYGAFLDAIGDLCRRPEGGHVLADLRRVAPDWLSLIPAFSVGQDRAAHPVAPLALDPHRMIRGLVDALESASRDATLLIVLEDLQWCDPSSLDVIRAIAARPGSARLMVVATVRTGGAGAGAERARRLARDLSAGGQAVELALGRFGVPEVDAFLCRRFPDGVPDGMAPLLHRRSSGNPLFLHELTESVRADAAGGPLGLDRSLSQIENEIPDSIRALVERQVDALGPEERALIEAAAVAGRDCCAASLAAATGRDWKAPDVVARVESEANALTDRARFLVGAGLEEWPDGTISGRYRFSHALHRDAVRAGLPPAYTARLHRRIAECLENAHFGQLDRVAPRLAHHYDRGGVTRRSLEFSLLAIRAASLRCARAEALDSFRRSLAAVERLPRDERGAAELALRSTLAPALARAPADPEAEPNYERALELCRAAGDRSRLGALLWGKGYFAFQRRRRKDALALSSELLELGQAQHDDALVLLGHDGMARSHQACCEQQAALEHAEAVWSSYDIVRHHRLVEITGHDPRMSSGVTSAFALWELGRIAEALERMEVTLEHARSLGNRYTRSLALVYGSTFYYAVQQRERACRVASEARDLARELEIPVDLAFSEMLIAACSAPVEERLGRMMAALAGSSEEGEDPSSARLTVAPFFVEALIRQGLFEGAAEAATEALGLVAETGDRSHEPYLLMSRAHCRADDAQKDHGFQEALACARSIGFRLSELRASRWYARFLGATGRPEEALALLAPILRHFEGEPDIVDLADARGLARALSSGSRIDPISPEFRVR